MILGTMILGKVVIVGLAFIAILAIIFAIGIAVAIGGYYTLLSHDGIMEQREDTTTHAPAGNVVIDASTFGGNIEVQDSDTGDIEVIYDVHATQGHLDDIVTGTNYSMDGDTLDINAVARLTSYSSMLSVNRGADIYLKLPKNATYSFTLNTNGGNVKVPDTNGANMNIETLGGNVDLNNVSYGSMTVHTSGGSIDADYSAATSSFDTQGGDIDLHAGESEGNINAYTSGGNIDVWVPYGTLFSVDARTNGGQVQYAPTTMMLSENNEEHIVGYMGAGEGNLSMSLQTLGGDIDLGYD
jgi:DUF4097 and DUF4098 domain-containing protein YvlB